MVKFIALISNAVYALQVAPATAFLLPSLLLRTSAIERSVIKRRFHCPSSLPAPFFYPTHEQRFGGMDKKIVLIDTMIFLALAHA